MGSITSAVIAPALEEPGPEAPHFIRRHNESRQSEYRTVVVPRVVSGNVRADMSELAQVSDLRQQGSKYTKARTCARASEGGQESSSASIATLACQLSLVNSWNCDVSRGANSQLYDRNRSFISQLAYTIVII